MRLTNSLQAGASSPLNYGGTAGRFSERRYLATILAFVALTFAGIPQALAQQANQPGFDPRQTEKYFETQTDQALRTRPPVRLPTLARPEIGADTRPQFVLRGVVLRGVHAIPTDHLAAAYQSYLGRKISQ